MEYALCAGGPKSPENTHGPKAAIGCFDKLVLNLVNNLIENDLEPGHEKCLVRSENPVIQFDCDVSQQTLVQANLVQTSQLNWFENGCFQTDLREVSWAFDPVDNKVVEIWNVEELRGLLQVVTGALTEVNPTPVQKYWVPEC